MKNEKDIKAFLSTYEVPHAPTNKIEILKSELSTINIEKGVLEFSPIKFLKSQLRVMRPSFWLICIAYIVIVSVISTFVTTENAVISLCSATSFLTIATMPFLFLGSNPNILELECSCIYLPRTVLAGKMVICGVFDLFSIIVCSIICSTLGNFSIMKVLVLGVISFTASSFLSLCACLLLKTQTGILLCVGTFALLSGIFLSNNTIKSIVLNTSFLFLVLFLILFIILLVTICLITFKKYTFERSVKIGY